MRCASVTELRPQVPVAYNRCQCRAMIDGDQLNVIGLSSQAAALVGKLEGAPQWTAPALSGALQQDPRTRMDRFTLVAQLAGKLPATASSPAATAATGVPR